jgi:hypothetical protein
MFFSRVSDIESMKKEFSCRINLWKEKTMAINSIQGTTPYSSSVKTGVETAKRSEKETKATDSAAAVYEPSGKASSAKKGDRSAIIAMMKEDLAKRQQQLQNIVTDMMTKQGQKIGQSDDIWKFLAGGNFTVDAATKAAAQKEIADDGYWGVEKTSDRIVDFAKALTGNDASKADKMIEAFKKGFSEATSAWGKTLPDISQRTYDAVLKKFDAWKNGTETASDEQ